MATTYPGTIDSFTNPSGTSTLDDPDHAGQHSSANDAIEAIEAVIGTTAGTSVLKDFSAGEFPVRQEGGTLTQTLTGGTINATTLGTPTVTGGSFASPTTTGTDSGTATLTNKTLTSPQVGTSINDTNGNEIIKTPATASAVNEITVTNAAASGVPTISSTGGDTNIHLSLDAKGSALVKVKVLRQDDTTDSYTSNSVILTGWGQIQGNGGTTISESVTFGITFSVVPIVIASRNSNKSGAGTALSDFTAAPINDTVMNSFATNSISTTGFTVLINRNTGTFSGAAYQSYTWIAIGQLL